jgi:hypothetical protein
VPAARKITPSAGLFRAIDAGESLRSLARERGVNVSSLSRYVRSERGLADGERYRAEDAAVVAKARRAEHRRFVRSSGVVHIVRQTDVPLSPEAWAAYAREPEQG